MLYKTMEGAVKPKGLTTPRATDSDSPLHTSCTRVLYSLNLATELSLKDTLFAMHGSVLFDIHIITSRVVILFLSS